MKRVLTITATALFAFAPTIGSACEYDGASSASAAPPARLASPPAATTVPAPAVANALAPKAAKQVVVKVKAPVPDQKVAVVTSN